ncbi:MAG: DNA cytosine methyltransferase [Nostoc sp. NMS7]|uniref:DNA cytosine methyltransferase n=1 Tax=Nostoc sp. NMS7 TaxID=2815391 RepID=UPI0025DBE223|nr:DNA cytosine methyltransferase [Nostoc sp. NMS7]MBN3945183.1 DNA cytosine methyltransferase [Nostoc sp. NMS7]
MTSILSNESVESKSNAIPEKFLDKKFEPVGCLYSYVETKKLKDGTQALYPRVIGKRDRTNPHHWRWGFNWKEKCDGVWKGKSIGSIPCTAVSMIREMQESKTGLALIIDFIVKAKKQAKTNSVPLLPCYPTPKIIISQSPNILFNSHFSGCGGSTLGAIAAGFVPIHAIENNPAIAELYKTNCGDILVADIATVDFKRLDIPTQLERRRSGQILVTQTSPPCQDFSAANTNSGNRDSLRANILRETWLYYEIFRPEYVVLENVPAYRHSKPYQEFEQYLITLGYKIIKVLFNAADYGVPQTRIRFFAIAVHKDYPIPQISPTHEYQQHGQLFLIRKPWIGWYESLKDLLPSLPESKLTKKQENAIAVLETQLIDQQNSKSVALGYKTRLKDKPSFTLGCNAQAKVLLIDGQQRGAGGERQTRDATDPCWTIPASIHKGVPRAVLIERLGYYDSPKTAQIEKPCWTLRAALADDYHKGNRTKMEWH